MRPDIYKFYADMRNLGGNKKCALQRFPYMGPPDFQTQNSGSRSGKFSKALFESSGRYYRPSFRENKLKTLVVND
jgi:hypothetical protein